MTAPRPSALTFRRPPGRSSATLRRLFAAAPAFLVIASLAVAQNWKGPPIPPDLKAAMDKADSGSTGELVKLADSGRADAQLYAGVLFIFGRGAVARDP